MNPIKTPDVNQRKQLTNSTKCIGKNLQKFFGISINILMALHSSFFGPQ